VTLKLLIIFIFTHSELIVIIYFFNHLEPFHQAPFLYRLHILSIVKLCVVNSYMSNLFLLLLYYTNTKRSSTSDVVTVVVNVSSTKNRTWIYVWPKRTNVKLCAVDSNQTSNLSKNHASKFMFDTCKFMFVSAQSDVNLRMLMHS